MQCKGAKQEAQETAEAFEDDCNTFTYSFQQDHHENIVKMIDYEWILKGIEKESQS